VRECWYEKVARASTSDRVFFAIDSDCMGCAPYAQTGAVAHGLGTVVHAKEPRNLKHAVRLWGRKSCIYMSLRSLGVREGLQGRMKTMRQDAWTADDDLKLADIVLRHIREASTQLSAFEETAQQLGRTPAACGYRWNACVRKQYLEAIELARLERKERREEPLYAPTGTDVAEMAAPVNWNTVLRFIRQYRHEFHCLQGRVKQLERDSDSSRLEVERLRKDKAELLSQLRKLSDEHLMISGDYRALLSIVDRARKRQQAELDEHKEAHGDSG